MAAPGIEFDLSAFASGGVLSNNVKVWGWVPSSAGVKTATPRTFYSDPALTTPATQGGTFGDTSGRRVVYSSPTSSIVYEIKSTDEATSYGDHYIAARLDSSGIAGSVRQTVANYAALTALTTDTGLVDNGTYFSRGRATEDDGGEQEFQFHEGDSDTVDGATILTHASGRFKALNIIGRSFVRPEQYGTVDGTAANDTAAMAAAILTGKVVECRPGRTYLLNANIPTTNGLKLVTNGCTFQITMGSGGFNSTTISDKNTAAGALFLCTSLEGVQIAGGLRLTANATTERVFRLIRLNAGHDDRPFLLDDIVADGLHNMGPLITYEGLGPAAGRIRCIRQIDGDMSTTGWTGSPQKTLVEASNDVDGTYPVDVEDIYGDFKFSGSLLSGSGNQTDVFNDVGEGATRPAAHLRKIYGKNVGEVCDIFGYNVIGHDIKGEDVTFVVKLIHGAQHCRLTGVHGYWPNAPGASSACVYIEGSDFASPSAGNRDTAWNHVEFTADNPRSGITFADGAETRPDANYVRGVVNKGANTDFALICGASFSRQLSNRIEIDWELGQTGQLASVADQQLGSVRTIFPTNVHLTIPATFTATTGVDSYPSFITQTQDWRGESNPVAVSTISRASNVTTIVTSSAHGLTTGDKTIIAGVADATFDARATVTVTNSTTFTYSNTGSDGSSSGGYVNVYIALQGAMQYRFDCAARTASIGDGFGMQFALRKLSDASAVLLDESGPVGNSGALTVDMVGSVEVPSGGEKYYLTVGQSSGSGVDLAANAYQTYVQVHPEA